MAFVLSLPAVGVQELPRRLPSSSPGSLLGLACNGRQLIEMQGNGFELAVDPVPHDCAILRGSPTGSDREVICFCFGWCGLRDGGGARFDDRVLGSVLDALVQAGPEAVVSRLTGNFLLLLLDLGANRAYVFPDACATRCFYFGASSDVVCISSRAAAVASIVGAKLDGMAWLAGVRGTVMPPEVTLFDKIRRSVGGQFLEADLETGLVRVVGVGQPALRCADWSFAESVERLAGSVHAAVSRCVTRQPICVDLTGGNDTRLTASALARAGLARDVVFRVTTHEDTDDGPLAQRIAATLGAELIIRESGTQTMPAEDAIPEAVVLLDGQAPFLFAEASRMRDERQMFGGYVSHLGSLGGELGRDFFWMHEYLRPWRMHKVDLGFLLRRRLFAEWQDDVLGSLQIPVDKGEHDSYLLDPWRVVAERMQGAVKFLVLDLIYVTRLARKMSATWTYAPFKTLMLPFLSSEFLDVALQIPWWQRIGRRATLEAVYRLSPELSRIPGNRGAPMRPLRLWTAPGHVAQWVSYLRHRRGGSRRTGGSRPELAPGGLGGLLDDRSKDGSLPEEATRLQRMLARTRPGDSRLEGLFGLAELLRLYQGIRREFTFGTPSISLFASTVVREASHQPMRSTVGGG